jgi:hypothetical protein
MNASRIVLIVAVTLLPLTNAVSTVQAATINLFNTGVDAGGVPLADGTVGDPHYFLVTVPGGTSVTLVRTSAGGFPIPPYLGNDSLSAWIGPNNAQDLTGPGGIYDYQTKFSLAGLVSSTASITGQWSSDNDGVAIFLNGVNTGNPGNPYGSPGSYSFEHWVSFVISSGFLTGLNTLDFIVMNGNGADDQRGPTSLRVEMVGTADVGATPLPSTWAMMLLGLAGLGFVAYRRQKWNVALVPA